MKKPSPTSFFAKADRAKFALQVLLEVMADEKKQREAYLMETRNCPQTTAYLKAKGIDSHLHFSHVIDHLRNYAQANGRKMKGI